MFHHATAPTPLDLRAAIVLDPLVVSPDTTVKAAIAKMSQLRWPNGDRSARLSPPTQAAQVADLHRQARASCVLVANPTFMGMVTAEDIGYLTAQQPALQQQCVADIMTQPATIIQETDCVDVFCLIELLQQHYMRQLPLLDDQYQVVGLITYESVLHTLSPWEQSGNPQSQGWGFPLSRILPLADQQPCCEPRLPSPAITERDSAPTCPENGFSSTPQIPAFIWQEAETKFRAIFEQASVGLVMATPDGRLTQANPKICDWLGYTPQDLLSQTLISIRHPDYQDQTAQHIAQLLQGESRPLRSEELCLSRAGERIWLSTSLNLIRDAQGQPQYFLGVFENIGDRKQVERALRSSEARWQFALEGAGDGVWDWQIKTNVVFFSPQWKTMLGYDVHEIGNQLQDWKDRVHPDDVDHCYQELQKHFGGQIPHYQAEHRIRCKNGHYKWILARGKVVERDEAGNPLRIIGTHTDISDRKQMEETLQNLIAGTATTMGHNLFPALVQHIAAALNVTHVMVSSEEVDGTHQTLAYWANHALQPPFAFEVAPNTPYAHTLTEGYYHCESNLQQHISKECILAGTNIDSYMGVALKDQQGNAIGNLCAFSEQPIPAPQRAAQLLQIFAARAGAELERQRTNLLLEQLNQDLETKVKDRTAKLKEREQFLQVLLDTLPLSIFWKNRNHVFLGCNRNLLQDAGLERPEDLIGKTDYDLPWCTSETQAYLADDQAVMETAIPKLGIIEQQTQADGQTTWIETHKVPLYDLEGQVIGVLGVYRDIRDRKVAENALRQSKQFLQTVLDAFPLSVFWKDRDCVYLGGNRNFLQDAGLSHLSELIGKTDYDLPWATTEAAAYRADDQAVMQTKTAKLGIIETQLLAEGRQVWRETNKIPLTDLEGQVIGVLGTYQDITQRKKADLDLQQTNEKLARATRLKDEFLANMSHELRTPLNAILGMAEGLQEQVFGDINRRQLKALQTIEKSGAHLLELINDILDLSKIESGQIELDLAPTSIAPLVQSSLTFIKQQAHAKQIQLETHLPLNFPDFVVDERRMRQVFINLLNNAVKFTPEGGHITLALTLHTETMAPATEAHPYLHIAVTDTGIGIAPEHLDRLFQPFVQVDSALNRKYGGTGLGLALVKRIVDLHGGQIGVTSKLGHGSCFTIDLPYKDGHQPSAQLLRGVSPMPEAVGPTLNRSPLILLVEDNEANIVTVSSYLRAKGYRMLLAYNGQQAITLAQDEQPDLVLMDIQMPGMDGVEAMRHIREISMLTVPIVALTALAMKGDRERCLQAGANDYLSKPVKLQQLDTTIQKLLCRV